MESALSAQRKTAGFTSERTQEEHQAMNFRAKITVTKRKFNLAANITQDICWN